jgi:hypothetical protein
MDFGLNDLSLDMIHKKTLRCNLIHVTKLVKEVFFSFVVIEIMKQDILLVINLLLLQLPP